MEGNAGAGRRRAPDEVALGATPLSGGIQFRVWAPAADRVDVVLCGEQARAVPMVRHESGVWEARVEGVGPGTRYRYRLNGGDAFPDPYSRFQPEGVHGPSEVVDLGAYRWRDGSWQGLQPRGLVIYECHVGAATPEGTFDALVGQLDRLRALGVTALQLMPVAEFAGCRNWGYDGVNLFAPSHCYGGPRALQRLVDGAHQRGLGVILDVVYNHLGPEGNYLWQYSRDYFTDRYRTPWGEAVNYDGPNSAWVRKLVIDNARSWVRDYHIDGLRLDATFKIYDSGEPHLLLELAQAVRQATLPGREVVLIAETSENEVRYLRPWSEGGWGFDIVWADDFHHALRRYLLGDYEGYYQDYQGTLTEVARAITQGFLFEGEWSRYLGAPRGTPARDRPAWQFQFCLQTHDQVGNRALGDRLHHTLDLDRYRAASALLLVLPYTPLLFMGQEFAASTPFLFFTDFSPDLGKLVTEGRRAEFHHYAAFRDPASAARIPDPQAESTFLRSKLRLDETERSPGVELQRLHQELLALRRGDPVLAAQDRQGLEAYAASDTLLVVRLGHGGLERLLLVNFGQEARYSLAAPSGRCVAWTRVLDTNEPRFGGSGRLAHLREDGVVELPPRSAVLLALGAPG